LRWRANAGTESQVKLQVMTHVDTALRGRLRIPIQFGAHPISRTIRIGAYFDFKLYTITFFGKHHFCLPISKNVFIFS
jgi:hypothetical protein